MFSMSYTQHFKKSREGLKQTNKPKKPVIKMDCREEINLLTNGFHSYLTT